ncbi:MAG: hypothetical protein COV57_03295 [Candidatus Liptonbacteria bacterium CG11_big_fil_rev_8_21_14_0_20_35_14]|uniref:CYTH domain-containing protein n=1 Tax=Candidatus Liptonbacteria bacterium CG11_big_fil_rev_8_21_14_0_20_35_14 TaxID=1974634 RepID=A0A2H0N6Y5_9BACT|nr:MAG: hypothetical protein COV57_03295 [Candidatus Liptonbacteria bacterium CG11_big_fil_rev_8_21_14_0_20_35_14]
MKNEYESSFININENEIKEKLEAIGAKLIKPKKLQKRIIFKNNTTDESRSWVRLRDEGDKITLTLKQVLDSASIHGTKEIEIIVNNFNKTAELLKNSGLYQENYQ